MTNLTADRIKAIERIVDELKNIVSDQHEGGKYDITFTQYQAKIILSALELAEQKAITTNNPEVTMTEKSKCGLCGEDMPDGEEMFKFHGYSGNCPKPIIATAKEAYTVEPVAVPDKEERAIIDKYINPDGFIDKTRLDDLMKELGYDVTDARNELLIDKETQDALQEFDFIIKYLKENLPINIAVFEAVERIRAALLSQRQPDGYKIIDEFLGDMFAEILNDKHLDWTAWTITKSAVSQGIRPLMPFMSEEVQGYYKRLEEIAAPTAKGTE